MKFAAIALVATASAIKVEGACVDAKEAGAIFNAIDTNDNGQVNRKELVAALKAFAKSRDYKPTKEDWAWVAKTAYADAGADKQLNQKEFTKWVNQFAKHFQIDGCKWASIELLFFIVRSSN